MKLDESVFYIKDNNNGNLTVSIRTIRNNKVYYKFIATIDVENLELLKKWLTISNESIKFLINFKLRSIKDE